MTSDAVPTPCESGGRVAPGAVHWLGLAAAPTFAIMALVTALVEAGQPNVLCTTAQDGAVSGMVLMYVLMSTFHSAPWLTLMSRGRGAAHRS